MAERVRVRGIDDDEGSRLLRTIRRGTGSVVTWRRARKVLLSAADRVRDVLHPADERRLCAVVDRANVA